MPAIPPGAYSYRIFKNGGGGPTDPIDYSTVIASGSSSPITLPALTAPGDYLIGIRAYDTGSSLEEANVDAVVRLRIDSGGVNITALPNVPAKVGAAVVASDTIAVTWHYASEGQGGAPTGFKVWATSGASVNYAAAPNATVPYTAAGPYAVKVSGLAAGTYAIGVRSYNGTGTETNTTSTAAATIPSSGPSPVESLAVAATAMG